jgi:hypothetical protein
MNLDLSGAQLRSGILYDSNLSGASLRGANLTGTSIRCVNLRNTDLSDIQQFELSTWEDSNWWDAYRISPRLRKYLTERYPRRELDHQACGNNSGLL